MAKEVKEATIVLKKDKECKGSIRYATADPDAAVTNIYLSKKFANPMPESVELVVRAK